MNGSKATCHGWQMDGGSRVERRVEASTVAQPRLDRHMSFVAATITAAVRRTAFTLDLRLALGLGARGIRMVRRHGSAVRHQMHVHARIRPMEQH